MTWKHKNRYQDWSLIPFLHIRKIGGTSLHQMLKSHFDDHLVYPECFNRLSNISKSELARYTFFSGHFDRCSIDLIPAPKKVISLFDFTVIFDHSLGSH